MSSIDQPKPAIVVKGLTKSFKIPLDKGKSVKSRVLGKAGKGYREFTPLNDISFTVYEGDFFGIIGRNGSGKSTLLKTMAGIYQPTSGRVDVNGTLVPFIELGVGFNPNLSGRENVYLNAALLGFSRDEIDNMYDDIVDFAELHDFMEERLQNYSSGMQVRLAFSISIRARGDILLLDEVLAVGDAAFQQKCYDYFEQLKRDKKTVILVTHSMANVERFCNRGLLLNEGQIDTIGSSEEIAEKYRSLFTASSGRSNDGIDRTSDVVEVGGVSIIQNGLETTNIKALESFTVSLKLKLKEDLTDNNITVLVRNHQDILVFGGNAYDHKPDNIRLNKDNFVEVEFEIDNYFTNGSYYVGLSIKSTNSAGLRYVSYKQSDLASFTVEGVKKYQRSLFHPPYKTEFKN